MNRREDEDEGFDIVLALGIVLVLTASRRARLAGPMSCINVASLVNQIDTRDINNS